MMMIHSRIQHTFPLARKQNHVSKPLTLLIYLAACTKLGNGVKTYQSRNVYTQKASAI
jgi:hypothetical protein